MRHRFHGVPLLAGMSILVIMITGFLLPSVAVSAGKTAINNPLGMTFVMIPAGSFNMGSPVHEYGRAATETRHRVTLTKPFYLQTTEVTVDQWRRVMGRRWFGDVKWPKDRPIAKVSWYDVQRFIQKLNVNSEGHYRLPTEAEWEYAARAASNTAYTWGDTVDCSRAFYGHSRKGDSECRDYNVSKGLPDGMPAPVKSYPANQWGLYDMHGSVWEWCLDTFSDYPQAAVSDPWPTDTGRMRVRRGGSWFSPGYACRSANRAYGHPASRLPNTGFRLVFESGPAAADPKMTLPRLVDGVENQEGP